MTKKTSAIALVAVFAVVLLLQNGGRVSHRIRESWSSSSSSSDQVFSSAFAQRRGNFVAEGSGTVARILPDDNDGSRHQRFILRLASGQTLLISHNIDIAPRIEGLSVGDPVSFRGEYEWNDAGGVIHWTHHDPTGVHAAGWVRHSGTVYQ